MKLLRTRLSATLGALALTLSAGAFTANQAWAAPEDCASWPSAANATNAYVGASESPGSSTYLNLWFGTVNGKGAGWASITGFSGDKVWFDVSHDGGHYWFQCGPFTLSGSGRVGKRTPAHYTSPDPDVVFRACGLAYGAIKERCTDWY
ncbi:hypothetical protein FXF51_26565 [Nonomuraea sp. PA05]|uniref:hypothetical protein n=1 Tax=Nonomuraea sp. PA05 TaxID=2604466 RepID=UPI0011D73469|nr:hypothetical protein [Nonomuraea sp. PA05]TYB62273.1 hypothetical protein FXF51_26565 [Nonomuraea sp. PA05]